MRDIEFHNRERETKEIRSILDSRPTLITFIYGPINSGKTELITHTIEELPEEYVVFYINLRTEFLSSYDDFIESLFEMEMESEGVLKKGGEVDEISTTFLVKKNILFVDPLTMMMKPQSELNLLAIREVMKDV